jgi:ribosomal protein L37AE/L43A
MRENEVDEYELDEWVCPRCYSTNIRQYTEDERLDGIPFGYREVWQCHDCNNEFDEPEYV